MPTPLQTYKDLLRRQRELDREYETLLEQQDCLVQGTSLLPPRLRQANRVVYINKRCALDRTDDGTLHFLTLPGQRAGGLSELRDFTRNAVDLIIVDPYIFNGRAERGIDIAENFKKSARVCGRWLKRIHFVYDPSQTTRAVKSRILKTLKDESIVASSCESKLIHDRVWIADRKRALVVGTSFNGLGGRAAFLLPLPDSDLLEFLKFLDENSLSRAEA